MAILTFQYLRELQKKERDSPALQPIDANFYRTLSECIKESSDSETIIQIIRSILDMRERKIVKTAINSARADIKPQNLLPEEEPLFLEVSDAIKAYRASLERALSKEESPVPESNGQEKPQIKIANKQADENAPAAETAEKKESEHAETGMVNICAISDIPAFVAEDMKTYGPVKQGETAKIPKKAAGILMKSKSAEILD